MDEISRQILINQRTIMSAIDEMQGCLSLMPGYMSFRTSDDLRTNIKSIKQILDNHQKGWD